MIDYKAFPIQNSILNGNIQYTLDKLLQMQQNKNIQFIETTIMTPSKIVDEMLDILPENIWNPETRFLNLACKDGIYVVKIFERLFKVLEKYETNETKRAWHILENQIYIACIDDTVGRLIKTMLYGTLDIGSEHVTWFNTLKDLQKLNKAELKQYIYNRFTNTGQIKKEQAEKYMNFDVVIGNPPYNNDIYLDFVTLSKELITHKENKGRETVIETDIEKNTEKGCREREREREFTITRRKLRYNSNRWHSLYDNPCKMAS